MNLSHTVTYQIKASCPCLPRALCDLVEDYARGTISFDGALLVGVAVCDVGKPGSSNFPSANLSHALFHSLRLEKTIFSDAILRATRFVCVAFRQTRFVKSRAEAAIFINCDMFRGTWEHADLSRAVFMRGSVRRVCFFKTRFERTRFGCSINDCNFREACLARARFGDVDVGVCKFVGADMEHSLFEDTRVTGVDFQYTHLEGAVFAGAKFVGSSFAHAHLEGARCVGASFQKCLLGFYIAQSTISRTSFDDCSIWSDFSEAGLIDNSFTTVRCNDCVFARAHFELVVFTRTTIYSSRFTGASLKDVKFVCCTLNGVDFSGATLADVSFIDCNILNTIFDSAAVEGLTFKSSKLRAVSFRGVALDWVDFGQSVLDSPAFCRAPPWLVEVQMLQGARLGARLSRANLVKCRAWAAFLAGRMLVQRYKKLCFWEISSLVLGMSLPLLLCLRSQLTSAPGPTAPPMWTP